MKICYIFWRNGVGGLEAINRIYYNYYIQNKDNGLESVFFILKPNRFRGYFSETDPSVKYGADSNFPAIFKLFYFLIKRKFDIIHLSNTGVYILFLTSLFSTRIIYHIHGTKHYKIKYRKALEKLLWRYLVKKEKVSIIANSDTSKAAFMENIPGQPDVKIIYNPVDIEKFYLKSRQCKNVRTMFYIGRFSKGKNLLLWLEVADKLHRKNGILSYLYGDGTECQRLYESININHYNGIDIKGFTNNPVEVYHKYDLMLFLSLHESFGNVVIESLLCGTPVLVLDIPVMKELLKPFPCFLIDSDKDIYNQVSEKISHIDQLIEEAQKASVYFSRLFSIKKHIEQFTEIYSDD